MKPLRTLTPDHNEDARIRAVDATLVPRLPRILPYCPVSAERTEAERTWLTWRRVPRLVPASPSVAPQAPQHEAEPDGTTDERTATSSTRPEAAQAPRRRVVLDVRRSPRRQGAAQ